MKNITINYVIICTLMFFAFYSFAMHKSIATTAASVETQNIIYIDITDMSDLPSNTDLMVDVGIFMDSKDWHGAEEGGPFNLKSALSIGGYRQVDWHGKIATVYPLSVLKAFINMKQEAQMICTYRSYYRLSILIAQISNGRTNRHVLFSQLLDIPHKPIHFVIHQKEPFNKKDSSEQIGAKLAISADRER